MQKNGRDKAIDYAIADSPLGRMLVARTDAGLCAVAFGEADACLANELRARYREAEIREAESGMAEEIEQVLARLEAASPDQPLPAVDLAGTAFERKVWEAMCRIPRGRTMEYGQFAASLGMPLAQRAVGAAIGKNPLAVLYPCHRLVASGGALHRYRWGVERKRQLLAMEREQAGGSSAAEAPAQGELAWEG